MRPGPILAAAFVTGCLAGAVHAQDDAFDPSAHDIENGKEIYETDAQCLSCHGWDGNGRGRNPRAPGKAAKLRDTTLPAWAVREAIACGRPGTVMPYHDRMAYRDDRCFGLVMADFEGDTPPEEGESIRPEEMDDLLAYLMTHIIGEGETTLEDCHEFYRPGHRNCRGLD